MTMRCGALLRLTRKSGENRLEFVHGKVFLVYLSSFRIALLTWCYHVKRVHRQVRYHKGLSNFGMLTVTGDVSSSDDEDLAGTFWNLWSALKFFKRAVSTQHE
eukprot:4393545-Amphidinium_carterae.1